MTLGSGIFLHGNGTLTVAAVAPQFQTIKDDITDGSTSGNGFSWAIVKNGTGVLDLDGNISHAGGTTVNAGMLQLGNLSNVAAPITVSGGTLYLNGARISAPVTLSEVAL